MGCSKTRRRPLRSRLWSASTRTSKPLARSKGAGPSDPDSGAVAIDRRGRVLGVLVLGVVIYVATNQGRIKIVVNGPTAVVKVDGENVRIEAQRADHSSCRRARSGGHVGRW